MLAIRAAIAAFRARRAKLLNVGGPSNRASRALPRGAHANNLSQRPPLISLNPPQRGRARRRQRLRDGWVSPASRCMPFSDGKAGISSDMALRFAALFGNSPMHWINMQALYDLQQSSARVGDSIRRIEPVAA